MCKIPPGLYISESYIVYTLQNNHTNHQLLYFIYVYGSVSVHEWNMHEKYKIEHVILMWTFSNDIATYNIITNMNVRVRIYWMSLFCR